MKRTTLKIFCIILSIIIWIQVASNHQESKVLDFPLEITGLSSGLTLVGSEWPETISVKAIGSKLDFFFNRYFGRDLGIATIDASEFTAGTTVQRRVVYTDIESPLKEITISPPVILELTPDSLSTAVATVIPKFDGTLVEGLMFAAESSVNPSVVVIEGPKRFLSKDSFVFTTPIDLTRLTTSEKITRKLVLPEYVIDSDYEIAEIEINVSAVAEKKFTHIPLIALKDVDYETVTIMPPVADIVLKGPSELLQGLASDEITILISLTGLEPGIHDLQPRVQLPERLSTVTIEPEKFSVVIGKKQE